MPLTDSESSPSKSNGFVGRIRHGIADYRDHVRLFSRNARLYLIGSFLMGINFQVFLVLLNLYLREVGYLEGDIGEIGSARAIGMTIMALPAAIMLARIRLKPFLIVATVLFAFFSYFIVSVDSFTMLFLFSLLSGTAFSIYRIAAGPFYMRNSTIVERTHLFSFSFGTNMLAGMVGALFCGRLAEVIGESSGSILTGYRYTLLLGIGVSLLALIPFGMIRSPGPSANENQIKLSASQFFSRFGFYGKVFFSNFLVGAGAGLIIPFLNLYFRDRFDLSPDTIGMYYSLVQFSMLAGSLAGPVLAKRYGLVRTVVLTQMLSIPFMLTLSYSYFLPLAVVAFVLRGGLMNLGVPIVTNVSMELSDRHEHGLIGALLMLGWTSAWMVSTWIGGHLIEDYGYTFTMNITIALYVIASMTFFWFFKGAERRDTVGNRWIVVRQDQA